MSSHRLYKFFAFISYSRKDAAFAEKVQSFLEHFKLPANLCRQYPDKPKNLRPIYRDKTDLAIDNLKDALQIGLENSKYLIVICSENSAVPNDKGVNWIDREIRQFVAIAPENVRRIIPILYRAKNSPRATECLPPAIKELGILAADIQDKGEKRVLSDVVAKMLNLQPDELWDRWTKAIKRKRRIVASSAAAILSGVGFFAWDFCVPKVSYYTDYVECNNIPQGIGELSESDITNRYYYKFTNQYYKLQTVESYTPSGNLCYGKFFDWQTGRPCKMVLEHDYLRNKLLTVHHIDAKGKVLVTLRFPDDECITFNHTNSSGKDKGAAEAKVNMNTDFFLDFNNPETEIRRKSVERDEKGYIITQYFQNERGKPRRDAEGVYGHRYARDSKGRIVSVRYLSKYGKNMLSNKGVAGYDMKWGDDDLVDSITNVDLQGRVALSDDNCAGFSFDWKDGDLIQVRFEDAEGKPCMVKQGFSAIRIEYNEKHLPIKCAFFDEKGNACEHSRYSCSSIKFFYDNRDRIIKFLPEGKLYNSMPSHIAGSMMSEFDERGYLRKTVYLGVDEKPSALPGEKIAGYLSDYDDDDREIKRVYIDADGKPCLNNEDGIASYCSEFDNQGYEIRRSYFGVDGEPCLSTEKVAGYHSEFDDDGNEIRRSYFGVDGEPCLNSKSVAGYHSVWNEQLSERKDSYFDIKGNPCSNKEGVFHKISKYNDDGQESEFIHLNSKEEKVFSVTILKNGFEGDPTIRQCRLNYDDKGNVVAKGYINAIGHVVKVLYVAPDGELRLNEDGVAGCLFKYDERGNVIEVSALNEKGQVFCIRGLDERGNTVKELTVGPDGKPCANEDGVAGYFNKYDEHGNKKTVCCLNEKEQIFIIRILDKKGNIVKELNIGPDGKPCADADGIAGYVAQYDSAGHVTKRLFVDLDGKLCAGIKAEYDENGRMRVIYGLDEKERIVNVGYFDEQGNTVKSLNVKRQFDEKGNILTEVYVDAKGKLCLNTEGFAGLIREYDDKGKEVKRLYIGEDGKLCVTTNGFAGYLTKYDEHGHKKVVHLLNEKEQVFLIRYFDENGNTVKELEVGPEGKLCLNEYGAAGCLFKYDERGNVIEVSALNEKEQVFRIRQLDEKGNIVKELNVAPDGKPCLNKNGIAGWVAEYDGNRNIKMISLLNEKEQVFRIRHLDEKGNMVKELNVGPDGKLTLSEKGIAIGLAEYDNQGRRIKISYFGVNEEPCLNKDGHHGYLVSYDEAGNSTRIPIDLNGNVIENEPAHQ